MSLFRLVDVVSCTVDGIVLSYKNSNNQLQFHFSVFICFAVVGCSQPTHFIVCVEPLIRSNDNTVYSLAAMTHFLSLCRLHFSLWHKVNTTAYARANTHNKITAAAYCILKFSISIYPFPMAMTAMIMRWVWSWCSSKVNRYAIVISAQWHCPCLFVEE